MTDQWVLNSQHWLNTTYSHVSGYNPVDENGITGWNTMFALTRGLQHELGITGLSDSFGPTTFADLTAQFPTISITTQNTHPNVAALIQCALWCKGYWGGTNFGTWDSSVSNSVSSVNSDMGIGSATSFVPKAVKSLFTMDAYVAVYGTEEVREVQQWLNGTYHNRRDFYIIPCDGHYSRGVQQGLMYAIQYELGMADGVANGNFGSGTQSGLQTYGSFGVGTIDGARRFVRLFQGALRFNGYTPPFDGDFGSSTASPTSDFQEFVRLPDTAAANYPTWASLLVSTGDPNRAATGADTSTRLTAASAANLHAAGYRTVARYLNGTSKGIFAGEFGVIFGAGLSALVIYEEYNNGPDYINYDWGYQQGTRAVLRARQLGLKDGATIYYPIDYDPTDDEITAAVIPYFQGVRDAVATSWTTYKIGVYGTRNVCARVSANGLAVTSWIAGMSTGWSGNLGFPLPENWAFDQIQNLHVSGLEIDKDVMSPLATPVVSADVLPTPMPMVDGAASFDPYFWFVTQLDFMAERAIHSIGSPLDVTSANIVSYWMMHLVEQYQGTAFEAFAGMGPEGTNVDAYNALSVFNGLAPAPVSLPDYDYSHWAVVFRGYNGWGLPVNSDSAALADTGGWAFDLASLWGDYVDARRAGTYTAGVYEWMFTYVGNSAHFGLRDLKADVDGYNASLELGADSTLISDIVRVQQLNSISDPRFRYKTFFGGRFGNDAAVAKAAVMNVFSEFSWTTIPYNYMFHSGQSVLRRPGESMDPADPTGPELQNELSDLADGFVDKLVLMTTNSNPPNVSN